MAVAKVILKAENNIKSGVNSAKRDLSGFEEASKKLGTALKSAFAITAVLASLKQLGSFAKDCFNEFAEGERRLNQLSIALDNNAASFTKATALIDEMKRMSMSSKGDIEELVAELAALGKSDEEIDKITRASVNLSNITGKGLRESFTQINSTYSGSVDELGKLVPELRELTKEQLASGEAADILNDKFGEMSKELSGNSFAQTIKNIKDDLGDMKQDLGGVVAISFEPLINNFSGVISNFTEGVVTFAQRFSAVLMNFPEVARLSFGLVSDIIKITFSWNSLKTIFLALGNYIARTFANVFTALPSLWWDIVKLMFEPIKSLGEYVISELGGALEDIKEGFKTFAEDIKDLAERTKEDFPEFAKNRIEGFREGVTSFQQDVKEDGYYKALFSRLVKDDPEPSSAAPEPSFGEQVQSLFSRVYSPELPEQEYIIKDAPQKDTDSASSAKTLFSSFVDMVSAQGDNLKELGSDLATIYEDIDWAGFKAEVDKVLAPSLEKFEKAQPLALQTPDSGPRAANTPQGDSGGEGSNPPPPPPPAEALGLFDQIKEAFSTGLIDPIKNSGLSTEDMFEGLKGSLGMITSALGPLTQIIFSSNPIMATLMVVFEGMMGILGPALQQVIAPLMDALTAVGETLGKALLPILDAIAPIFNILANILITALMPVIQMLAPVISLISFGFQMLSPILALVAKAFTILMAPVQFLGDLFSWLGGWITALGKNIGIAIHNIAHPFRKRSYESGPGSFSSDAFSGLGDRLAAIDGLDTGAISAGSEASTATAVSNASYTGAGSVTINIYQEAPVVGDGGMEQFAKMIKEEFQALNYYNV